MVIVWIIVAFVALAIIMAYPWVLGLALAIILAVIALGVYAGRKAQANQGPQDKPEYPSVETHPNRGRVVTQDLGDWSLTERVDMVVDVPRPPGPPVSIEKKSRIVSIFTKKWSNIAWNEFIVLDLETTGLYKEWDRIVEISAIRYRNGVEVDKFVSLVNPECRIPYPAMEVHRITDEMVASAPILSQILQQFLEYLGDSLLVGHNASFDIGFIEVWSRRYGLDPSWKYVDTISVARKILPGLPSYKQKSILDHIGYEQSSYHRAENDCRGCAEIMMLGLNSVLGSFGGES